MAFTIELYNLNKKSNSDKIPVAGDGNTPTTISNCRLKAETSVLQPVIILNWNLSFIPNFNYMHIAKFNRYYWITDIVYNSPMWEIYATVDVLGSYRDKIKNTYQYIDRCSDQRYYNNRILDSIYPALEPGYSRVNSNITSLTADFSGGSYVLGTISGQSRTTGAISYYVVDSTGLSNLLNFMLGGSSWTNVTDIESNLLKTLFNPFEYIVSCEWFPIPYASMPMESAASNIKFGWWDSGVSAHRLLTAALYQVNGSVSIPRNPNIQPTPQDPQLSYLMLSPYSQYTLFCGAFGEIPIDTTKIYGETTLYLSIKIDLITGLGKLYISTASGTQFAFQVVRAQISCPIQLAQISRDVLTTAGTALNAVDDIVKAATGSLSNTASSISNGISSGGAIGGGAGAVIGGGMGMISGMLSGVWNTAVSVGNGIISTTQAQLPQMMTNGSTGSTLEWNTVPYLLLTYFNIPDVDIANRGMPCCQRLVIDDLTGFIQVMAPVIQFSGLTMQEQLLIKQHMQAGFYHE